ncbi:flavin monoamine oxidase family protein [Sporosalibacterium faouarense]|uniref:flavin monoamine oxidase family protein n=1 Tax=Sporosalibacterium faouarense TaxID=516123 RepID=UPI0024357832|nr:NAD(P)/FAD-dependent oxidoreductase [Sporosalibacterium faouarense]
MDNLPPQPNNPTRDQRYNLIKYSLMEQNRLEDFPYIINNLSPPEDITRIANPGEFKNIKIGIIGGGMAGLSAAFELRKLGFDITIFEALKDRIGGRIYTYYFNEEKTLYSELGAMRLPVCHETTWHYIDLFNLDTRPFVQSVENGLIYANDIRVRNDSSGINVMEKIYPKYNLTPWERITPWMDLLDYGYKMQLFSMPTRVRAELVKVLAKYSPQILYWDSLNNRQLYELVGLSESAIMMLSNISSFGSSFNYYNTMDILYEYYTLTFTYLYEIIGGLVKLPEALYDSLVNDTPSEYPNIPNELLGKVNWQSGTTVNGVFYNYTNDKVVLRYKNDANTIDEMEEFDYIVCAIPFSVLRTIEIYPQFSNTKMQAIKELGYAGAQKTLLLCKERFWEQGGPNERILGGGSFTDLPILSIWYPSDFKENKQKGVLIASYNFTSDSLRLGNIPKPTRVDMIKNQVAEVHGLTFEYIDSIVEDYASIQWYNHPQSLGAFSYFLPGQKRLFSYPVTQPEYNNKVFFAGEHISVSHGWINGAALTGMKAANSIAKAAKFK